MWTCSSIFNILMNPVYCGKIRRGWHKQVKRHIKHLQDPSDYEIFQGLHPQAVKYILQNAGYAALFAAYPVIFHAAAPSIVSMNTPYPLVGSLTSTCVTTIMPTQASYIVFPHTRKPLIQADLRPADPAGKNVKKCTPFRVYTFCVPIDALLDRLAPGLYNMV